MFLNWTILLITPQQIVGSLFFKYKMVKLYIQGFRRPYVNFVDVQTLSHAQHFAKHCKKALQASLSFTLSGSLLKLVSSESVMPSNHLILCHLLLLLPLVFSNESALPNRWLRYWCFSFSISPSNEYSGLNFFRIDHFDLFAVQGTLKSLLQHCTSKAS